MGRVGWGWIGMVGEGNIDVLSLNHSTLEQTS